MANENPRTTNVIPVMRPSNHFCLENDKSDGFIDTAFSRKVSVSVADAGETAVVVSMVDENQMTNGPSKKLPSTLEVDKDLKVERFEIQATESRTTRPFLKSEELELCLSQDTAFSLPCCSSGQSELKMSSADKLMKEPSGVDGFVISPTKNLNACYSANEPSGSHLGLDLGLSMGFSFSGMFTDLEVLPIPHSVTDTYFSGQSLLILFPFDFMKNNVGGDQAAGDMQQKGFSEEYLLPGVNEVVCDIYSFRLGTFGHSNSS